jgi:hypothetical protein
MLTRNHARASSAARMGDIVNILWRICQHENLYISEIPLDPPDLFGNNARGWRINARGQEGFLGASGAHTYSRARVRFK